MSAKSDALVAPSAIGAAGVTARPATRSATAPAAAEAAATATTAAGAAFLARLGLVDCQGPALVVEVIQALDGLLRLRVVFHLDEPEAARPAGLAVGDHLDAGHLAELAEQLEQIVAGRIPHEVAHVDILRHQRKPFRAGPECCASPGALVPKPGNATIRPPAAMDGSSD